MTCSLIVQNAWFAFCCFVAAIPYWYGYASSLLRPPLLCYFLSLVEEVVLVLVAVFLVAVWAVMIESSFLALGLSCYNRINT